VQPFWDLVKGHGETCLPSIGTIHGKKWGTVVNPLDEKLGA